MNNPTPSSSVDQHRSAAASRVLRIAIMTVSDTRTIENDTSGGYLADTMLASGHQIVQRRIVRDELLDIRTCVETWSSSEDALDAILVTGGTGISPRDVTPEAIEPLLDQQIPGFGELFRMLSYQEIGGAAMLSRAFAGRIGKVLIFCLPGSTAAVRLAADKLLARELPHLVHHSRG